LFHALLDLGAAAAEGAQDRRRAAAFLVYGGRSMNGSASNE
jgi:hypothetical protein